MAEARQYRPALSRFNGSRDTAHSLHGWSRRTPFLPSLVGATRAQLQYSYVTVLSNVVDKARGLYMLQVYVTSICYKYMLQVHDCYK
jgi:hypothetical protein